MKQMNSHLIGYSPRVLCLLLWVISDLLCMDDRNKEMIEVLVIKVAAKVISEN
jgi:hypothetical protein